MMVSVYCNQKLQIPNFSTPLFKIVKMIHIRELGNILDGYITTMMYVSSIASLLTVYVALGMIHLMNRKKRIETIILGVSYLFAMAMIVNFGNSYIESRIHQHLGMSPFCQ